ncbi:hypothetical protein QTO34_007733, partial [Cnephaeus nilssonii]
MAIKGEPPLFFSKNPELQMDFHTGTEDNSDSAFHFPVYFGSYVVVNSHQVNAQPLSHTDWAGRPFDLHFLVLQNKYQVMLHFSPSAPARICEDDPGVEGCLPELSVCLLEKDVTRLPIVKEIPHLSD